MSERIQLKWLEEHEISTQGVTWGVHWAKGILQRDLSLLIRSFY